MTANVTLVGNITRDPELRFTPSGQAIATFGIAVNRMWTDRQSNERKESTSFFDVKCWGQLGENVGASLQKGSRVIVSGRLEQRSYETQQGDKRSVVEVTADEVGPSLRWAQATINRNERKEGGGDFGSARTVPNEPSSSSPSGGYASDEEPF